MIGGITHRYKKGEKVEVSVTHGSPKECWRINLETRSEPTLQPLILTGINETQPVIVVYRGECQKMTDIVIKHNAMVTASTP